MMYLYFLASLRSLNAVMHSCETTALDGLAVLASPAYDFESVSNVGKAAHDLTCDRGPDDSTGE
jgi:hypothetical protein